MKRAALLWVAAGLAVSIGAALWPVSREELRLAPAVSLRVEARDGTVLREFAARAGEGHAAPVQLETLPPYVWQAFVAAEDQRFFQHHGIDLRALVRAAREDLRRRRFAQGGSTLTMQLARLLRPHARSLPGKLAEMFFAVRLERTLSKREILEQYLARVPLGNDVRGVEAASRLYFGRPARALNPSQAALLAALPRSPAALDPLRNPGRAREAARRVLQRMGLPESPLDLNAERLARAFDAAHFVEEVARRAPPEAVAVRTTLDLALQRELEAAMRDELSQLRERRASNAAAVVLDSASGAVLAWVGSPDWFDEEHAGRLDAVLTRRQPGSTLKPFAYGEAIETRGLTAATLLPDVDAGFATPAGYYQPHNYDRRAHGPVRARVALASSYNVPAVHVAELLGAPALLRTLRRAGFASLGQDAEHYGLGLVLGDGEVSLLELARGYAALARGGVAQDERLIAEARDASGGVLPPRPAWRRTVFRPTTAALLADMLSDAAARAPAFGLDNALRFAFPVAAKTGTSRAFTDNWTVGFTHERTVAVWVGNADGSTMRQVSGITGAGPLFHRAMSLAMRGVAAPAPLAEVNLEERELCALSGALRGPHCPSAVREKFVPGTAPRAPCAMHGPDGVDLGPAFYDWAAHEGVETLARGAGARAALAFPHDGDAFLRDPALPDGVQTIPVRVLAPAGAPALRLELDGRPSELRAPWSTRVPAAPGAHVLRVFRSTSAAPDAEVRFRVDG